MTEQLFQHFQVEFAALKKELKFKATLEELDSIFFLKDYVFEKKYVSSQLSRTICSRIVELFMRWYGYLHNLIIPMPNSMVSMTESEMFGDEEKQDIMKIMRKLMVTASQNSLIGLTKDKKQEAKFIDDAVSRWNEIKPKLQDIIIKVNKGWNAQVKHPPQPQKPDASFG